MFDRLRQLLAGTVRRQLIVGMVLVVASAMSLLIWDMTRRQQNAVLEQQTDHAVALARSVAASSAVWVAARDFSGLQEIVRGLSSYPDLRYAIVLDLKGQVLAHSDPARRGQYLTELPQKSELTIMQWTIGLADVASPIVLGGNPIGWVWIGLSRESADARLSQITRNGIYYALMAIALSAFFAVLAGRHMTRRLYVIQQVADAVQSGQTGLRANLSGDDEAAQLARQFNGMLDILVQREEALKESEALLNTSQHLSKIGGWEWDVDTRTMTWTDETYRIHDLAPGSIVPGSAEHIMQSLAYFRPEDRAFIRQAFERCVEQGEPYDVEVRFSTPARPDLWVRATAAALRRKGRIVKVFGNIMDITERKQLEEEVRQLAFHDPLTQLPNRRLLNDRLRQAMAASARSGSHGALMFLDLDNFKSLNDTHGHDVGDLLLIEAAERLQGCVREMDTVARFGGDEFVVMISELDVDKARSVTQAGIIAEKIRVTLSEPYQLIVRRQGKMEGTVEHHCTASIGVSLFFDHETSQEDILKRADTAMYHAKEAGRNTFRF